MSEPVDGTDRRPAERADVCIVGAGPAGALVADRLAERGHAVVVLEAGKRFDRERRVERMRQSLRPGHDDLDIWEMGGPRDEYTSSGSQFYPLNRKRVKGVGGSTLHWVGRVARFHEKDFEMESRYGLATDWPIDYDDLRPYYAAAERELGVAGAEDNPFSPPRSEPFPMEAFPRSYSDSLFARACDDLEIATHSVPQARNSEAYRGRSQCVGFGTCHPVCPSGAKYSADVHVRAAEERGARVIDRAPVQRLEHDREGERVEAAVYATPDGRTHRQSARRFVLACGGIETPRLLLLSRSETYPDGLANSSGAVGRYLMESPYLLVQGRLDRRTRQHLVGFGTLESHQFYTHDDPTPGSFKIEFGNTAGASPVTLALRQRSTLQGLLDVASNPLDPSTLARNAENRGEIEWGDDLLSTIRAEFGNRFLLSAELEALPRRENRVTLDPSTTDSHGNPVPDVSWHGDDHARRTADRAEAVLDRILEAVDADVTEKQRLLSWRGAGHPSGTTRMGSDPTESVVDRRLQTHDLRNLSVVSSSVFVTKGAMQPTLTIAALALRAADHVDESL